MEVVLPDIVHPIIQSGETNQELKGIDYINVIPILTQAIKEQQVLIEELKEEVNTLKTMVDDNTRYALPHETKK